MKIGWIGTGNMGLGMAMRLVDAGHHIHVYNRTREKALPLIDTGKADYYDDPRDIFKRCDIVFSSVTNDDVWKYFLDDLEAAQYINPGQVFVEMSTLSPDYSASLGALIRERGGRYINSPVIGSMFMIRPGLLKILVSGDKEAYETALPLLKDIGKSVVFMGDGLQARYMKIAVNMMICSYLTIYGEFLLAGEGMGLSWDQLNDILESGKGASDMLKDKGTLHRSRTWGSQAALTSTALKDLGLALECAIKGGYSLPLTAVICQYDRFMHYNSKYTTYSTFGTIGMLEDLCGILPADKAVAIPSEVDSLENALTAVTLVLACEALLFCRQSGIDMKEALSCLGECHGATVYFKKAAACSLKNVDMEDDITLSDAIKAMDTVLEIAKNNGLFVPIIAVAAQRLAAAKDKLEGSDNLSKMIREGF